MQFCTPYPSSPVLISPDISSPVYIVSPYSSSAVFIASKLISFICRFHGTSVSCISRFHLSPYSPSLRYSLYVLTLHLVFQLYAPLNNLPLSLCAHALHFLFSLHALILHRSLSSFISCVHCTLLSFISRFHCMSVSFISRFHPWSHVFVVHAYPSSSVFIVCPYPASLDFMKAHIIPLSRFHCMSVSCISRFHESPYYSSLPFSLYVRILHLSISWKPILFLSPVFIVCPYPASLDFMKAHIIPLSRFHCMSVSCISRFHESPYYSSLPFSLYVRILHLSISWKPILFLSPVFIVCPYPASLDFMKAHIIPLSRFHCMSVSCISRFHESPYYSSLPFSLYVRILHLSISWKPILFLSPVFIVCPYPASLDFMKAHIIPLSRFHCMFVSCISRFHESPYYSSLPFSLYVRILHLSISWKPILFLSPVFIVCPYPASLDFMKAHIIPLSRFHCMSVSCISRFHESPYYSSLPFSLYVRILHLSISWKPILFLSPVFIVCPYPASLDFMKAHIIPLSRFHCMSVSCISRFHESPYYSSLPFSLYVRILHLSISWKPILFLSPVFIVCPYPASLDFMKAHIIPLSRFHCMSVSCISRFHESPYYSSLPFSLYVRILHLSISWKPILFLSPVFIVCPYPASLDFMKAHIIPLSRFHCMSVSCISRFHESPYYSSLPFSLYVRILHLSISWKPILFLSPVFIVCPYPTSLDFMKAHIIPLSRVHCMSVSYISRFHESPYYSSLPCSLYVRILHLSISWKPILFLSPVFIVCPYPTSLDFMKAHIIPLSRVHCMSVSYISRFHSSHSMVFWFFILYLYPSIYFTIYM